MKNTELKPCPFCGDKERVNVWEGHEECTYSWQIECPGCDFQITKECGQTSPSDDIIKLRNIWNQTAYES